MVTIQCANVDAVNMPIPKLRFNLNPSQKKLLKRLGFEEDGGCYRKFYDAPFSKRISVYGNTALYLEHLYGKKTYNADGSSTKEWAWHKMKSTTNKEMLSDIAQLAEGGIK